MNQEPQRPSPHSPQPTPSGAFARVRVVLVETSHPGNVGSVARAMKTMGFGEQPGSLVLVSPREPAVLTHPDAVAMASGADDVLAGARIVDDIEAALTGAALTVAMTARQREFGPPRWLPREAAERAGTLLARPMGGAGAGGADPGGPEMRGTPAAEPSGAAVAFVFGNERYGLPNGVVERCSAVTHIPANPAYASLNLAQAVQLLVYEMRLALLALPAVPGRPAGLPAPPHGAGGGSDAGVNIGYAGEPATAEQIESMFGHLQAGLVAIGFLDPDNPRKLMPRLRRLFARSGLEREEVNILRGIARDMVRAGEQGERGEGGEGGEGGGASKSAHQQER